MKAIYGNIKYLALLSIALLALAVAGFRQVGAQVNESASVQNTATVTDATSNRVMAQTVIVDEDDMYAFEFEGDCFADEMFFEDEMHDEALAELLGTDVDTLFAELESGKSLAEIAAANGVAVQTVTDSMMAQEEAFINELLAGGEISAEEAAEWKSDLGNSITFEVNQAYIMPEQVAADALGMTIDELWAELEADKSIAEIAAEKGVDVQVIIDAVVANDKAETDALVEAGMITAEEAAEWEEDSAEFAAEIINAKGLDFDMYDEEFDVEMFHAEDDAHLAELLGTDVESLYAAFDSGQSIDEIATANGVDTQVVIDSMVADELAFIDELLAEGEISAEEAAEWKAETEQVISFEVNTVFVMPEQIAADALGMTIDELWTELEAGQSIADVATEKGVDPQVIIDAIIADEKEQRDEMVEAGLITAEEAAEWEEDSAEFAAEIVNDSFSFEDVDSFHFEECDEEHDDDESDDA